MQRKNTHILSVVTSAEAEVRKGKSEGEFQIVFINVTILKKEIGNNYNNIAWQKYGMYSICYKIL